MTIVARGARATGTLLERTNRFVMLLHLSYGHGAKEVETAIGGEIRTLLKSLTKTIPNVQVSELPQHVGVHRRDRRVHLYLLDTYSPWQLGSNENTIGLLRQYITIPIRRGTDLSTYCRADLKRIQDNLNDRPRIDPRISQTSGETCLARCADDLKGPTETKVQPLHQKHILTKINRLHAVFEVLQPIYT